MDIHELNKLLHDFRRRPRAFVMSRAARYRLENALPFVPAEECAPASRLFGTPLYDFAEVPEQECVVFYCNDALALYSRLRQRIGHVAALKRLRSYVDPDLIHVATIRVLLETS